jgi:hypothetical protein
MPATTAKSAKEKHLMAGNAGSNPPKYREHEDLCEELAMPGGWLVCRFDSTLSGLMLVVGGVPG